MNGISMMVWVVQVSYNHSNWIDHQLHPKGGGVTCGLGGYWGRILQMYAISMVVWVVQVS